MSAILRRLVMVEIYNTTGKLVVLLCKNTFLTHDNIVMVEIYSIIPLENWLFFCAKILVSRMTFRYICTVVLWWKVPPPLYSVHMVLCGPFCNTSDFVWTILQHIRFCMVHSATQQIYYKPFCNTSDLV